MPGSTEMVRRRAYPSDVSDRQWARIQTILPSEETLGRPPIYDFREVVNALSYRWRSNCSWRMLPHDLPLWTSVYRWERLWERAGCLQQLRDLTQYGETNNQHIENRGSLQHASAANSPMRASSASG
ncbi:MAG: transposase [Planctomycetaceae bacterium]